MESQREECRRVEAQLQKKEVALTAAQGKIELLTSEMQAKVCMDARLNICFHRSSRFYVRQKIISSQAI